MSAGDDRPRPTSATGSIPLSWVQPAEDVSADVAAGSRIPAVVIVVALALIVIAALWVAQDQLDAWRGEGRAEVAPPTDLQASAATPSPPTPSISNAPEPGAGRAPVAVAPEDDDAVAAPEPAETAAVVDAADSPAGPIDEAARKRARVLLRAARFAAKDGDYDKASALAEDAVDTDPRCAECWATVGFLRKRAGDLDGFQAARLQARALAP